MCFLLETFESKFLRQVSKEDYKNSKRVLSIVWLLCGPVNASAP